MINKKQRGNALIAFLCGAAGVVVGALIVFFMIHLHVGSKLTPDEPKVSQTPSSSPTASFNLPQIKPADKNTAAAGVGPDAIANAIAAVEPAVVNIDTTVERRVFQGGIFGINPMESEVREIPQGMGTGFIVSEDGIVLTNNHVIRNAKTINVTLNDRRQFKAKLLGNDSISDLAILKIDSDKPFPVAKLANSEEMRTGDWVVAIGNPLGVGQTATVGVLSARGRSISDTTVELRDLLQTDAAINPGNSGGPLINLAGEVIGINTAIIRSAQGIGFAIPAETAMKIMASLKEHGRVVRPYLGIEMGELTPAVLRYLELPETAKGVVVGRIIPKGPADNAGIQPGDIITKLNGKEVENTKELQAEIRSLPVNSEITVSVIREKKNKDIKVKLEEMPTRLLPGR
ncbi:MAG: trypsin-like peptidase domain-containing protein [bacterium]|nr:trypsin-like peptidase domain-containing protein [bacterium]